MSRQRLLFLAAILLAAGLTVGPSGFKWLLFGLLLASIAWHLNQWLASRGRRGVLHRLRQEWLELPGARPIGRYALHVHDGVHPITIRFYAGQYGPQAVVLSAALESPLALRVWLEGTPAPPMHHDGSFHGGPVVERAPMLETLFAGLLKVDTNDESTSRVVLAGDMTAALLAARKEAKDSFAGLTYDGSQLGIHLRGDHLGQPESGARLARTLRRRFPA